MQLHIVNIGSYSYIAVKIGSYEYFGMKNMMEKQVLHVTQIGSKSSGMQITETQ